MFRDCLFSICENWPQASFIFHLRATFQTADHVTFSVGSLGGVCVCVWVGGTEKCWPVWKQRTPWDFPEISRLHKGNSVALWNNNDTPAHFLFDWMVTSSLWKGSSHFSSHATSKVGDNKTPVQRYTLYLYILNNHSYFIDSQTWRGGGSRFCNRSLKSCFGTLVKGEWKKKLNRSGVISFYSTKQHVKEIQRRGSVRAFSDRGLVTNVCRGTF